MRVDRLSQPTRPDLLVAAAEETGELGVVLDAPQFADRRARHLAAAAFGGDPRTLAMLAWVRARVEFGHGTPRHASEMVLDGAETVYDWDQEEAARMLIGVVSLPTDHPLVA